MRAAEKIIFFMFVERSVQKRLIGFLHAVIVTMTSAAPVNSGKTFLF